MLNFSAALTSNAEERIGKIDREIIEITGKLQRLSLERAQLAVHRDLNRAFAGANPYRELHDGAVSGGVSASLEAE